MAANPNHERAIERATAAAIRWLEANEATVRFFAAADNCVRRREADEAGTRAFVIEVQGVQNLFHELAHVVLLGRVAKDHATEYSRIPFRLDDDRGRTLLHEELACCLASCAWHPGPRAAAVAWLDEQVGIQPCFFGMEGDLGRFLAACERALAADRERFVATCQRALDGVREALIAGGMAETEARPPHHFEPLVEWTALCRRQARDNSP